MSNKNKFPTVDFKQYEKIDFKELYYKEKQRAEEAEKKLAIINIHNFVEARNELFKRTINEVLSDALKEYDEDFIKTITFKFDPTLQRIDDYQCKCTYISIASI